MYSYKRLFSLFISTTTYELKKEYMGTFFGILWAFLQPISMLFIMWFIFTFGFRRSAVENVPFVLWISTGLIPWYFIANSLSRSADAILSQAYLVKKVVFPIILLPVSKIGAQFFIHIFLLFVFSVIIFLFYSIKVIYLLQLIYYLFATILLLIGFGWIFSSLNIFLKDIKNFLPIFIQFSFWVTPIFWDYKHFPSKYLYLIYLNPFSYIIEGYRNTFIYHKWFWEVNLEYTLIYWIEVFFILSLGYFIFKRLQVHFVDII